MKLVEGVVGTSNFRLVVRGTGHKLDLLLTSEVQAVLWDWALNLWFSWCLWMGSIRTESVCAVGIHLRLEGLLRMGNHPHIWSTKAFSEERNKYFLSIYCLYFLNLHYFFHPLCLVHSTLFNSFYCSVHLLESPRRNSMDIFSLHPPRSLSSFNQVDDSWNLSFLVLQETPFPWAFFCSPAFTPSFFIFSSTLLVQFGASFCTVHHYAISLQIALICWWYLELHRQEKTCF